MRLHTLHIQNVRGIRSLSLSPAGANFVVWGPNGSGKSAVVDAIDFLITGRMSRLSGKGTKGITLSRHGPHIDTSPDQAFVQATIGVRGVPGLISLRRSIADPETFEIDPPNLAPIGPILALASSGQHVLSRREILRFITSEASTRAQDIQSLLNLSQVETTRKALVSLANDALARSHGTSVALESAKLATASTIGTDHYDPQQILDVVTHNRRLLGAPPPEGLASTLLKKDAPLPAAQPGRPAVNVTLVGGDIAALIALLEPAELSARRASCEALDSQITELRRTPELLASMKRKQLLSAGLALLDESGACPLCDKHWPRGELNSYLRAKLARAHQGEAQALTISHGASQIMRAASAASSTIKRITPITVAAGLQDASRILTQWGQAMGPLLESLADPLNRYPAPASTTATVARLSAPDNTAPILEAAIVSLREAYPEATPELTAWEVLTRLEENLKAVELQTTAHHLTEIFLARAIALRDAFMAARDETLTSLYDSISGRFSDLYRKLHEPDEGNFAAQIHAEGAGLAFEVDFYGRGVHPPHALHSEGHQDSMGICLYLALSERLNQGLIDLTILDDVVMSVDAGHRRQICHLLATEFPERQFLITTHDRTWANQLRTEGIVTPACRIEFANWSLETGPLVSLENEMWQRITTALEHNDMPSAAVLLRRGSEEFFATVCNALEASVPFRIDGRYELGDLLPAAVARYRRLLKQAKASTQSWGNNALLQHLTEVESVVKSIFVRTQAEQWAVNATLHYNNWANLHPNDFRPVVEAFLDMHEVFTCQQCRTTVFLLLHDNEAASVRCHCGSIDWNLEKKS